VEEIGGKTEPEIIDGEIDPLLKVQRKKEGPGPWRFNLARGDLKMSYVRTRIRNT
jgi:hypothetical protein